MDITNKDRYAQKRDVSVGVYPLTEAQILAAGGAEVANLPRNILVVASRLIVTTASTTATSNVTVSVGATAIHTNAAVASAAVVSSTTAVKHFPSGGMLSVVGGSTPPAAGDLEATLVVEYIELDKTTGEYTVVNNNS